MRWVFEMGVLAFMVVAVHTPRAASGQEEKKTHEVKAEKFEVQIELAGVFAAEETVEISIEPESWSQFEVLEAVPHGAEVSQGQVLVRFDDEQINEAIEDMQADQQLAELAIIQAEQELPRLERSLNLQYETAEREQQNAREDLERWQETDRTLAIKSAEFSLKNAEHSLEYQREELEQLEQMYEADDLTEETEEIILKRQRNAVESAEFSLELAKNRREEVLNVQIPRADAALKTALERAELDFEQAKSAVALSTNEKQFALQKAKHQRQRSLEKHAQLLADRELLIVKSPIDGVVYYGRAVDGKWSQIQATSESLRPGGSVSPGSVFMTIVQLRPLAVLSTLEERDVVEVETGATATITPTADEDLEIRGRVRDVSAVPVGDGEHSLRVELTGEVPEWVVPGMTCSIKVTTYSKDDALVVPASAVRSDEADEEKKYVLVKTEDADEPQRRDVKVGHEHNGKTEILEGLKAGERVVLGDAAESEPAGDKEKEPEGAKDAEDEEDEESSAAEDKPADESDESSP